MPYFKCLGEKEAKYALKEVYKGIYGNHLGVIVAAHKLIQASYYWPSMKKDATALVQKCENCQMFSRVINVSSTKLTHIFSSYPFAR